MVVCCEPAGFVSSNHTYLKIAEDPAPASGSRFQSFALSKDSLTCGCWGSLREQQHVCTKYHYKKYSTNMDALISLPSRGFFEVVDGIRALQPPAQTYVSFDRAAASVDSIVVTNAAQQLHELYRDAHKRNTQAVLKRSAQHLPDARSNKRHQSLCSLGTGDVPLKAAIAAMAAKPHNQAAAPATRTAASQIAKKTLSKPSTDLPVAARPQGVGDVQTESKQKPAAQQAMHSLVSDTAAQPNDSGKSSRQMYTVEQLKIKTNKELVELLRARKCPVSGQKVELIRRLLDYQRRVKLAQCGTLSK